MLLFVIIILFVLFSLLFFYLVRIETNVTIVENLLITEEKRSFNRRKIIKIPINQITGYEVFELARGKTFKIIYGHKDCILHFNSINNLDSLKSMLEHQLRLGVNTESNFINSFLKLFV